MSDLPLPLPDRRTLGNSNIPIASQTAINKFNQEVKETENLSNKNILLESIENSSLSIIKLKQIEDMRQKILNYQLLSEKTIFLSSNNIPKVRQCNIILFGPSGSGKSSFIKSLYRALYNSPILPPDVMNKLKIKSLHQNEGTLNFTKLHLVEESKNSSDIILCDTRGHVNMSENEKEQFKIIIEGKVKDGMRVEQRKNRDPFSLWEFWKKSSELFPNDILNNEEPSISNIPHSIVFIFDGSSDEIVQQEDELFYKDLILICKRKGFTNVQVVLTRIDVFEKNTLDRAKSIIETENHILLNKKKDEQIERAIQVLGVPRSNIHFLENYHLEGQEKNSVEIDYHILKTMIDILNAAEEYICTYMARKETCFCFGGNL
jgi:GTPase SAR1 family protein